MTRRMAEGRNARGAIGGPWHVKASVGRGPGQTGACVGWALCPHLLRRGGRRLAHRQRYRQGETEADHALSPSRLHSHPSRNPPGCPSLPAPDSLFHRRCPSMLPVLPPPPPPPSVHPPLQPARHVPHLTQPLGEDTPLCLLPPDRRYASPSPPSPRPHTSPNVLPPLVSLQQMVLFGQNPSQGTLLRGSQFLLGMPPLLPPCLSVPSHHLPEELPVRLAHRVKELDQLPHSLGDMPSINKVKNWYAQSFEVCSLPSPIRRCPSFLSRSSFPSHQSVSLRLSAPHS